ncbi:MAG: AraC family transcriptional regulator [Lentisphaerales bacterium]|nr:AraC family transcriptional regulator [Lentisphaerales bacterium]
MKFDCSLSGIPQIDRAGEYPLLNADLEFIYQPPTHSIHLYDYDGIIKLDSEEIDFRSGDLTIEPTGHSYSIYSEKPGKHWCIHFFLPVKPGSTTFKLPVHISLGGDNLYFLEQMKHISHLVNNGSEMEILEAAHRLKALLISLYNLQSAKRKKAIRSTFVWEELIRLIEDNLSAPLSTPWLAKRMNITSVTLSKKFKKEYHCTISQYILRKRVDWAKSLLTTTHYTICEVGATVGIDDPQYFNKQFRKVTGVSPSIYRQDNKTTTLAVDKDISTIGGRWSNKEIS